MSSPNLLKDIALTTVIFVMLVTAFEVSVRANGFVPELPDNTSTWSAARLRAVHDDDTIVIVGSSRFQLGLDPSEIGRELDKEVVQLSINGGTPLPVFEHLANDTTYAGTVVVEYTPHLWFGQVPARESFTELRVAEANARPFADPLEYALRSVFYLNFSTLRKQLNLKHLGWAWARGKALPSPPRRFFEPDRHIHADVPNKTVVDIPPVASEQEISRRLARWTSARHQLDARGARIIFLQSVSASEVRVVERETYPDKKFFEPTREAVGGEWIHFEDVASLRELVPPDGSHLNGVDADKASRWLGEYLANQQPSPSSKAGTP